MNRTKQPVIQLIVFAFLLVVATVVFYYSQNQIRLASLAQAEINQLTESQARLTELATLLPKYSLREKSWLATLPQNEKEVAAFAESLERLAKTKNLVLTLAFDDFPGPVDGSGHYIAGVGAEISLEGSYAGIASFLANLTDLPYHFKVDKMALTKPDRRPGVKALINGSLMMNLAI